MNESLETALRFASRDPEQLKALARQESRRSELLLRILVAVLRKSGPVRLLQPDIDAAMGGFEISPVGENVLVPTDGNAIYSIPPALVEIRATN